MKDFHPQDVVAGKYRAADRAYMSDIPASKKLVVVVSDMICMRCCCAVYIYLLFCFHLMCYMIIFYKHHTRVVS